MSTFYPVFRQAIEVAAFGVLTKSCCPVVHLDTVNYLVPGPLVKLSVGGKMTIIRNTVKSFERISGINFFFEFYCSKLSTEKI